MASQVDFQLEYCSDEEIQEPIEVFRSADLPILTNPSPFNSEESSSESDTPYEIDSLSRPSTPSTPTTPSTPSTSLGTSFSFIGLSSQTSEEEVFVTPSKPKRKKYVRKPKYNIRKGHTLFVKPTHIGKKTFKVSRPSSYLYKDVRFQIERKTYDVKLSSDGKEYEKLLRPASGNQIINLAILAQVLIQMNCSDKACKGRLHLYEHILQDGLQKFLLVKCGICHRITAEFPSSLPIGVPAEACLNNKSLRVNGQSELNVRSLLAVHTTSQSWEDFLLTCSLLDLDVPAAAMSQHHLKRFVESTTNIVSRSMKGSGMNVHYSLPPETSLPAQIRNCIVSFDASWHRRGHFSNQGFAAAIDSQFGKVLDYQLYDRVCYPCSHWNEERKANNPEAYTEFWATHEAVCTANFTGSSQSMESSAAGDLEPSIVKHDLVYGTYIGDGDSSSYKNLVKSDPYNGVATVRKEECLGHVQKRVKKRLRKPTKFSKGLPETKADRIAHLYALLIVQHKGETALEIQEALHILLRHTQEKHDKCPGGSASWCYFQKAVGQHLEDSTIPYPKTRAPFLTDTEFQRTVEVFAVYASLAFCETITLGKTHNSNESLHNIIWHNAPKAKRVGQKSLIASTALAVLSFNEGSLSYSVIMEELGLKASYKSLKYLATRDRLRNQSRIRTCRETYKRRRRQIVAQTKLAESSRKRRDKAVYSSGRFGSEVPSSGDESDTLCGKCQLRESPIRSTRKYQQWVCCHLCEEWYHWSCEGIKSKRQLPEDYFCSLCKS